MEYVDRPMDERDLMASVRGLSGPATRAAPARKHGLPLVPPGGPEIDWVLDQTRRHVLSKMRELLDEFAASSSATRATVTLRRGITDVTQWPDGARRKWGKNPRTGEPELLGVTVDGDAPRAPEWTEDGRLLVIIEVGDWNLRQTVDEIIDERIETAIREAITG